MKVSSYTHCGEALNVSAFRLFEIRNFLGAFKQSVVVAWSF
jgi:hypothetical protein